MNNDANYDGFPKIHDSLLEFGVSDLMMGNLDIIEMFTLNRPYERIGMPLKMVPDQYVNADVSSAVLEEVICTSMSKLRLFLKGTEPIQQEEPYGITKYWSFNYKDQLVYVTEVKLYPNTEGSSYLASPISAGISVHRPEIYSKLSEVDIKQEPQDVLARIGRRILKLADRIDPTVD